MSSRPSIRPWNLEPPTQSAEGAPRIAERPPSDSSNTKCGRWFLPTNEDGASAEMNGMPSWATDRRACDRRHLGVGRHPAGLNFGDCLSYATADLAGEPLLFVGDDFAQTDIEAVLPSRP